GLLTVRAELLVEDRRCDEARALFERASWALDGGRRDAPATRAAIAAVLSKALNLDGIALAAAGNAAGALFAFKRSFDLAARWASPLVNMGVVFVEMGRPARARACYERALVLDDDNLVARYNLALLARARGDFARAEAELRRVLAIDPDYPGARLALDEITDGA